MGNVNVIRGPSIKFGCLFKVENGLIMERNSFRYFNSVHFATQGSERGRLMVRGDGMRIGATGWEVEES